MKHTNKLWALLFALIALVALCAFAANAEVVGGECGQNGDNVTWSYDTETKEMTVSGTGLMMDHPDFGSIKYEVETLVLQDGILSIGEEAFVNFLSLQSVSLPDGLQKIGLYAFGDCPSLESITIPASVTSAVQIFAPEHEECNLTNITLSEGMKRIDIGMLMYTPIEEIVIPNSVETVRVGALVGPNLKTVHMGKNLESIGLAAFYIPLLGGDASQLTIHTCMTQEEFAAVDTKSWTVDEVPFLGGETPTEEMIAQYSFLPDGATIEYASHVPSENGLTCTLCGEMLVETSGYCGAEEGGENLTWEYDLDTKTLTISGEGEMADYDFDGDPAPWEEFGNEIQSVVLEEGVTSIGFGAFFNYESVSEVTLPESLEKIGEFAFCGCPSLTTITIPKNVTTALRPFMYSGLSSVTLEEGLTKIDAGMFLLTDLRHVVIPDSVSTIGVCAFAACPDLETVRLGSGVRSIGYAAFEGLEEAGGSGEDVWNDSLTHIKTCMNEAEWATVAINVIDTDEPFQAELIAMFPGKDYKPAAAELVLNAHETGRTQENTVPAACETPGQTITVTFCALCQKEIGRVSTMTQNALGHDFGTFAWTWSNDGTMASATATCGRCRQTKTLIAEIEREEQADETILCTATVTVNGQTYTDQKIVQPGDVVPDPGDPDPTPQPTPGNPSTFRCGMCSVYEEYKGKGFIGLIVSLVHTFVHLAARISAR